MTEGTTSRQSTPAVVVATDGRPPVTEGSVRWGVTRLVTALLDRGVAAVQVEPDGVAPPGGLLVRVSGGGGTAGGGGTGGGGGTAASGGPESLSFARPGGGEGPVVVSGGDARGVMYGLLELADRVVHASDPVAVLRSVAPGSESPATPVRAILRTFACEVEDKPWFYDRDFWTEYLTELATNRVNRFQLALGMQYNYPHHPATDNYLCFPYPFFLDVAGYDVRAGDLSTGERERNLATLRFISDEAARRGIDFQLGLWNHAYDQGEGSRPHYPIEGLTQDTHADYCAKAVNLLLRECPAITGLTIRVHYEGGIPEIDHGPFWRVVMKGIADVGRPIQIDMHAKGVDEELLDIARETGMPVVLGAKYWAEHQGLPYHQTTIRDREKATADPGTGVMAITAYQRRFTRYGYGDFLREGRDFDLLFRIWPGTQKVLLWGDPELAAGYGRLGTLGGAVGVEWCEPLTFKGRMGSGEPGGRDLYADPALRLDVAAWRKYRYTYRLWGRLLYDPDADADGWRRFLRTEYGDAASAVEAALGPASRILPLVTVVHGLGASNNGYWPEIYLNMPIAGGPNCDHYERDTAKPATFGGVSSFDPSLFYRIDEFADDLLAGRRDGRYSPIQVAEWLEGLATDAEHNLTIATDKAADVEEPQFRRTAIDIAVQAGLGRFFAGKFRAGLSYALYERTKDIRHLAEAVQTYRNARDAYAGIANLTTGIYRNDLTFGIGRSEHGHWAMRIPDIDTDLNNLERQYANVASSTPPDPTRPDPTRPDSTRPDSTGATESTGAAESVKIPDIPRATRTRLAHTPPSPFVPGTDIDITTSMPNTDNIRGVDLHYRHLNQGEDFVRAAMTANGGSYHTTVPSSYTNSPYPLVYYFTVHHQTGDAWILPGLEDGLATQPYHVVRQTSDRPT